ncbi:MAG: hypothetical protein U9M89_02850 [Patescibacteria group bacterium]|nr:hypothetical protein [Patescibacteria group bacterium]
MNLSELRTRMGDLYGPVATSEESYYNRVINDSYQELASITRWWWLETQYVFTTLGYAQEIEVDATDDSDTLTPAVSATMTTDYDGGWLKTGEHTYRIIDASDSNGDIELDADWIEDTDSDATAYIWNDIFNMPTDFDDVISVSPRSNPDRRLLRQVAPEVIDALGPDVYSSAVEHASSFCVFREADKSTVSKIRINPPPSEEIDYIVKYIAFPATLSNDTDSPLLPTKHHGVLASMAKLRLVKERREDADVVQNYEIEAQRGLQRLWREQNRSRGVSHRFGRRGGVDKKHMFYRPQNVSSTSP